jgi:hypothetical protein
MEPVSPVVPGFDLPEVVLAEHQSEYAPLPAYRDDTGNVVTRWRFTWRERIRVLLHGNLWLVSATFNHPLQPVYLDTECPIKNASHQNDKEWRGWWVTWDFKAFSKFKRDRRGA